MGIRKELNDFLKNTTYGEYGPLGKFDHVWPISGTENDYIVHIKELNQKVLEQDDLEYMERLRELGQKYGVVLFLDPEIFRKS